MENEYQCPNCKEIIKGYETIFSSGTAGHILKKFICVHCGFDIYPHFKEIKKQKQSKIVRILFTSIALFFISLYIVSVSAPSSLANFMCLIFLLSIIVGGVSFVACVMNNSFSSKAEELNNTHTEIAQINKQNEAKDKLNKILDELIENEGLLFNKLFNSSKSALDKIGLSGNEDIINQRIKENKKADAECLMDATVSEVKKLLWEDSDVDLSVIDKDIAETYKNLPVSLEYLLSTYDSNYITSYSKAEIREDIQDELETINNFYSLQLQETKELLQIGIDNLSDYDFDWDLKRLENLKYYPSCQIDYSLNNFEQNYKSKDKEAIEAYISRILSNSIYPNYIKKEFELEYNPENNILVLNYSLPNIDEIPNTKEISFISAKNSFKELTLKTKELNELYDDVLYQIALRTNYEVFKSDSANHLESVVFNGWIEYTDKTDGKEKTACIMSIKANKEEFLEINLSNVEPKQCFKKFRGIGHSGLYNIIPVPPILKLNKSDRRFVEGYDVMYRIEDGDNLATMDWQDFENLIREVFEKEFCQNGCEVKLTQQSRDGGVDAVLYDNNPITGGKIIIQAKCYNNVVGLSAVRDLYGAMTDIRAMKAILITTSYYGSDSYEFVKDKPITLLDGNDLLNLLAKHGYKARINLKEAKELQKQQGGI